MRITFYEYEYISGCYFQHLFYRICNGYFLFAVLKFYPWPCLGLWQMVEAGIKKSTDLICRVYRRGARALETLTALQGVPYSKLSYWVAHLQLEEMCEFKHSISLDVATGNCHASHTNVSLNLIRTSYHL